MSEAAAQSEEEDRAAPPRARAALPSAIGFVLTIAVVWLGGQYLTQGVSDELVESRPALAVLWRGDSADALAALAHKDLPRNSGGAVRLSLKALQHAPLDTLALTTYGLAEARLGDRTLADRAIALSGSRGWRDVLTQIWLFRSLLMQARFQAAFRHADALMRREDVSPPVLYRILAVAARDPPAQGPLAARLAADPNWRQPFFATLASDPSPLAVGVYRALLERLLKGPTPPTSEEVGLYLSRLVSEQDYAAAEQDWRTFSPERGEAARGGAVHDGDFAVDPGSTPFDWTLRDAVGWSPTIDSAPAEGGGRALRVEYDGVSMPQPLRQLVVLAPGRWRLTGRSYDQGGAGAQLFKWRVMCANDPSQVLVDAPAPVGAPNAWRSFTADFAVPAAGCPAQWLQLEGEPGDIRLDAVVWFDDLALAPVANMSTAAARVPPGPAEP